VIQRAEMPLPAFRYHPDPVGTGSVIASDATCVCCGEARGFVYAGPAYAAEEYDRCICPWCVADGTAHERLGVSFTDEKGIGGYGAWDDVAEDVIENVAHRTPGFTGWQQEQWWTHCGDAAQFVGRAGRGEVEALGPEALAAIRESAGPEWDDVYAALDKDGSPTAYLFRCAKCGRMGGYWDCD
jgi:uncharacterized protein